MRFQESRHWGTLVCVRSYLATGVLPLRMHQVERTIFWGWREGALSSQGVVALWVAQAGVITRFSPGRGSRGYCPNTRGAREGVAANDIKWYPRHINPWPQRCKQS